MCTDVGPSASWTRQASRTRRSTMVSVGAPIRHPSNGCATGWPPMLCTPSGAGSTDCPRRFTADDLQAGYAYELAFRQFEVSDTRVFDRPQTGRAFFEGVIRDHLDVGRPDQVAIIFDRRVNSRTPGAFRTKVIPRGVDPQVCCYYKSPRLKQYFKEHRALRLR